MILGRLILGFLQKIVNRHKQQSEKAKELIEKLRHENGKSIDFDEVSSPT